MPKTMYLEADAEVAPNSILIAAVDAATKI
jgi:hypothetical protein